MSLFGKIREELNQIEQLAVEYIKKNAYAKSVQEISEDLFTALSYALAETMEVKDEG